MMKIFIVLLLNIKSLKNFELTFDHILPTFFSYLEDK